MKVIILRDNLKTGLEVVSRAVSENSSLPILKTVLIKDKNSKIDISGTNLELAITSHISGKIIEQGELVVPFGVFLAIISNLDADRIQLEKKNKNLILKTDNYSATIQGMEPSDFPIIPKLENNTQYIEINSDILKNVLAKVIPAAQLSDFRPELNGVLLDFQIQIIKFAATDSFRLSEATIPASQIKSNYNNGFKAIIPLKTAQEILRIIKNNISVRIYVDNNQMLITTDDFEIISRLVEGNFPDYEQIIPKSFDTEILVNRDQFMNAVKLASTFTTKINDIKFRIQESKKTLEIYSSDSALGENTYIIPAKIKGKPVDLSFNWRFLSEGLKALSSETVFFGINSENKPAILKSPEDGSYFYIVMPIKPT